MNPEPSMKEHPVTDYQALLGEGTQLVDVREADEVAQGTLPEAIHIPLGDLPSRMGELDSARQTLLLCRSGGRSGQAAQFLAQNGFEDVTNLVGGMLAWADR